MGNIVNEILVGIEDYVSDENMTEIQNALFGILNKYNCEERKNELSVDVNGNKNLNIIKVFKISKKVEGIATSSLEKYEFDLTKLFEHLEKDFDKIETNDIRRFLSEYQFTGKKKTNTTMDNMRQSFSSFFSWCVKEGYIQDSPMDRISKIKRDTVKERPYTIEEMENMLYIARNNLRNYAILYTLYSTGCRVQELCNINLEDINWNDHTIHIIYGKGGNCRYVHMDGRCRTILKKYILEYRNTITSCSNALFVNIKGKHDRITTNGVRYIIKEISKEATVDHAHPHRYRVTRITNLLQKGVSIQEVQQIAGHKNINTTSEYNRADNFSIMTKLNMVSA